MKTIAVFTLLLAMPLACSKPDAAPAGSTGAGASAKGSAEAPKTAAAPAKAAFVQKGIAPGKVIVGYMQDAADPSQCSVVTDAPAKKEEFTKNGDKVAQMMKAKIVPSCSTDNVVGTCDVGLGMLVNYSGPKWTKETAQKECASHPHTTWVE